MSIEIITIIGLVIFHLIVALVAHISFKKCKTKINKDILNKF